MTDTEAGHPEAGLRPERHAGGDREQTDSGEQPQEVDDREETDEIGARPHDQPHDEQRREEDGADPPDGRSQQAVPRREAIEHYEQLPPEEAHEMRDEDAVRALPRLPLRHPSEQQRHGQIRHRRQPEVDEQTRRDLQREHGTEEKLQHRMQHRDSGESLEEDGKSRQQVTPDRQHNQIIVVVTESQKASHGKKTRNVGQLRAGNPEIVGE